MNMYAYILKYCIHFISFCFIYPANPRSRLNKLRLSYSKRWMLTFVYQLDNYWKPDIVVRRLTSNVYFFGISAFKFSVITTNAIYIFFRK